VTLIALEPPVRFPLDLLVPDAGLAPAAAAFAALAREVFSGAGAA
jgi:hypothetical protein